MKKYCIKFLGVDVSYDCPSITTESMRSLIHRQINKELNVMLSSDIIFEAEHSLNYINDYRLIRYRLHNIIHLNRNLHNKIMLLNGDYVVHTRMLSDMRRWKIVRENYTPNKFGIVVDESINGETYDEL